MHSPAIRAVIFGAAFALSGIGLASAQTLGTRTVVAQTAPTPVPQATPTPSPITYGGYIRSYYFTRLNNPQLTKSNPLNQASLMTAASVHAAYTFFKNLQIGGTYLYGYPFYGKCNTAASHAAGPPCVNPNTQALIQGTNPDDTLPGFTLNTLYEAYLQYKDPNWYAKLGTQVLNTPWANPSDSRVKPVAFLGGDVSYTFSKQWLVEAVYMNKFQARASSDFLQNTLLTATNIADAPGAGSNLHLPKFSSINTPGFYMGRGGYTEGPITADVYWYSYVNIVNALWLDGKQTFPTWPKPFIAVQLGAENETGSAVIGKINSQVIGVQGGISPWKTVDVTLGYNYIPQKTNTMVLPAGVTCSATGTIGGTAVFPYFLPSGGTPQCHNNGNGTATVYYGGWASPYTDSYATDPLFSTSISQGMVDRRSPGQAIKLQATFYSDDKRIRFIASRAWYDYGNATGGVAPTQENDLDGTYFFNHVPAKGTYHGLSFRYRYAERTQAFFTTNPDFKYNRAQLEYDF